MQKGDESGFVTSASGIYPEFQDFLRFAMRRIINDHVEKAAATIADTITERWNFITASAGKNASPDFVDHANITLACGISEADLSIGIGDASRSQFFKDFKDVLEQQTALACSIKSMLIKDPLSGLFNNAYFDEAAPVLFRDAKLSALAFIDIDKFKTVNEKYGHRLGNSLIASFGSFLKEHLSRNMAAFRYGGDEFAIIFSGTDREEMTRFLNGLLHSISKTEFPCGGSSEKVGIAISCGCAFASDSLRSESAMLSAAENAMFNAKNSGGGKLFVS